MSTAFALPMRLRAGAIAGITAATIMLGVACDAPTGVRPTFAYDPTTLSNGQLYRWANGQKIRVWADLSDSSRSVNLGLSVRNALAQWNPLPSFGEFELVLVKDIAEAQIVIYDRSRPTPVTPGSCAFEPRAAVGYTYFCVAGNRAESLRLASGAGSQIRVVIRVDDALATSQSRYDAVVAHEFGHALGIGAHSSVATDLMFGLPTTSSPSGRDAQTLQYVLGTAANIVL